MAWYTENAAEISFLSLLVLTFVAIAVAFVHNLTQRPLAKIFFTAFFVMISIIAWHANKIDRKTFEARLTGGSNFAYVRVREALTKEGGNLIAITTTGALPSLRIGFYPLSLNGTPIGERWVHFQDLPLTTFYPEIALVPGRYRIDFMMGEKTWVEFLEFDRSAAGIDQIFWIERNNKIIYRGPE